MAGFYGNAVARSVVSGSVFALNGAWTAARAGTSNAENRQWIKIQPQARDTIRLAIRYVNKNADGTFTTPTSAAHGDFKIPATGTLVEPISSDVTIFIRAVQSGGSSGGIKCIVAEFS